MVFYQTNSDFSFQYANELVGNAKEIILQTKKINQYDLLINFGHC